MTKIFIDTNVFFDMYRANMQNDIKKLMRFLQRNKKYLITTEQSFNELVRNRHAILNEALEVFKKQTGIDNGCSSLVRSLSAYKKYSDSLSKFREQRSAVIDELLEKIEFPEKDEIFSGFLKLFGRNNTIELTNDIIDAGNRRKISGNPPTSDKYTCCDEIIWESLLAHESKNNENLVIVSKDKTFMNNKEFLTGEYFRKTGCVLSVCDDISEACRIAGIEFSPEIEQAEENLKWTDIIVTALMNLGGEATLSEIYNEANDILSFNNCQSKMQNKAKESTIRGILQRFSSDFINTYNGSKDLFHQISDGVWSLR